MSSGPRSAELARTPHESRFLMHLVSLVKRGRPKELQHATQTADADSLLWFLRWKFLARASRLGYNVMSVDADSIFFRDPYVFLKAPPLKDINVGAFT